MLCTSGILGTISGFFVLGVIHSASFPRLQVRKLGAQRGEDEDNGGHSNTDCEHCPERDSL